MRTPYVRGARSPAMTLSKDSSDLIREQGVRSDIKPNQADKHLSSLVRVNESQFVSHPRDLLVICAIKGATLIR